MTFFEKIAPISFLYIAICPFFLVNSHNPGGIVAVKTEQVDENTQDQIETSFAQNDVEDLDVFQPTSQWQDVLPGQAIPAGLHVRMNLQTGKKEAKLLSDDNSNNFQALKNGQKQKYVKIDQNFISKTKLKKALKDFKDVFHDGKFDQLKSTGTEPGHFRSMEEIRKELKGADIFMKKDIEILKEHVEVLNSSSSTLPEKVHALDELEYFVHQIYNALDFNTIGGLHLIVKYLNSSEAKLRIKAAHVLGSAVQSNPKLQVAALKKGMIPFLLRLMSKTEPMEVRRKALFAISSLIRLFFKGQQQFLKLNGLETLNKLFDESGTGSLRIKVITLMTDLLHEQIDFVTEQFKKNGKAAKPDTVAQRVPLLKAMVKQGWCNLVSSLLNSSENDVREKVLQALHVMVAGCKQEFQKSNIQDSLIRLRTEWQKSLSSSVDPDDYIKDLSQLVNELISKLQ